MKEDINKWRGLPGWWIGRQNIVKISYLPKLLYTFNMTLINILIGSAVEISKFTPKFILNFKGH